MEFLKAMKQKDYKADRIKALCCDTQKEYMLTLVIIENYNSIILYIMS